MANKLSSNQSIVAFKPTDNGRTYSVVSINSGYISLEPFSSKEGFTKTETAKAFSNLR